MNERQDYFGQTVNIASRVQDLADSSAIFVTGGGRRRPPGAGAAAVASSCVPVSHNAALRGIEREIPVFTIP